MEEPKTQPQEEAYYSSDPTPLNEILGATPGWLLRSGIGIVAFFVFLLLGGSMLFRYPDIVEAPVVVVADNPPVNLISVSSGKLERMLKAEGDHVEKGELIAVIESPLHMDDVLWLRNIIADSQNPFEYFDVQVYGKFAVREKVNLGPLQPAYNEVLKNLLDYKQFENLQFHPQRIQHFETQLKERKQIEAQIRHQLFTFEKVYHLSRSNFQRDSLLFSEKFISAVDYERTQSEYLSRRITLEEYQSQLINLEVQKNDIRSSLLETGMDYTRQKSEHKMRVRSSFENLKSQLLQWEKNYAFLAPVCGELVFSGIWVQNQHVNAGEPIFSIIPHDFGKFVARGGLPLYGSGKVKIGNRVNIRLAGYPYQEFGVLQGEVSHIAAIPSGEFFPVQVHLNNGLKTSYHYPLGQHVMLDGIAHIITEDISLFNRMMNPLRSLQRNR